MVRKILKHDCWQCKKEELIPFSPPTHASIPDFQLLPFTKLFTYTGVDNFDPFPVFDKYLSKRKTDLHTPTSKQKKAWGIIFTCLSTRAVHFLALDSLHSTDLQLAFESFFADRGTPKMIMSDNALQFHLLAVHILNFWNTFTSTSEVNQKLDEVGVLWLFTSAKAP